MNSGQKSSVPPAAARPYGLVESLAGSFHPHAIEVQEFSSYGLVLDLRPAQDFEADHIPGAFNLPPPSWGSGGAGLSTGLSTGGSEPPATVLVAQESAALFNSLGDPLAALVNVLKPDQPMLLYCGRGGADSLPVAKALRQLGWTVDVLPGGWINYRRWVQAGLEVLPRLVRWRCLSDVPGRDVAPLLVALRELGEQVLDVASLTGASQPWFESQLLAAIRSLDPQRRVWLAPTALGAMPLVLPAALTDAIAVARVIAWDDLAPLLGGGASGPGVSEAVGAWLARLGPDVVPDQG